MLQFQIIMIPLALTLQGGFSAIGENSGSQFLDISLANKVQ